MRTMGFIMLLALLFAPVFVPSIARADDVDEVLDDLVRYQSQVRAEARLQGENADRPAVRLTKSMYRTSTKQSDKSTEKKPANEASGPRAAN